MANGFQLALGEQFIQCPYHEAHLITNAKFSMHLQKCRTAYIKEKGALADFKVCRFNFNHRLPNIELREHERTCPDQYSLIRSAVETKPLETYATERESTQNWNKKRSRAKPDYDDEEESYEDWEGECNKSKKPAYDPTEKLKTQVIHYIEPGLTKSERRDRRLENRRKQFDSSSASDISIKKEPNTDTEQRNSSTEPSSSRGTSSFTTINQSGASGIKSIYPNTTVKVEPHVPPKKTVSHKPKLDWDDDD